MDSSSSETALIFWGSGFYNVKMKKVSFWEPYLFRTIRIWYNSDNYWSLYLIIGNMVPLSLSCLILTPLEKTSDIWAEKFHLCSFTKDLCLLSYIITIKLTYLRQGMDWTGEAKHLFSNKIKWSSGTKKSDKYCHNIKAWKMDTFYTR